MNQPRHLLSPPPLDRQSLRAGIDKLLSDDRRRYHRLWAYYRNPMRICAVDAEDGGGDRPYRQAQEWGLPSRITGRRSGGEVFSAQPATGVRRKEVVIENDIGWRLDTMVDFLFGKPVVLRSAAPDPQRREMIGELLRLILAHNGGINFLQQLALLGSVYGFVDVLVKLDAADESPASHGADPAVACSTQDLGQPPQDNEPHPDTSHVSDRPAPDSDDRAPTGDGAVALPPSLAQLARRIRLEVVEPARALPFLSPHDYRVVEAYAQVYELRRPPDNGRPYRKNTWLDRLLGRTSFIATGRLSPAVEQNVLVAEVLTAERWQRFEDEKLVAEGRNSLAQLPLVHVQNVAMPFEYAGLSEVEPLIPLQDELNTRLSDRANRITLQSFKMYLGKGIDGFLDAPVSPGRMWVTDNPDAEVIEFGGDTHNPAEDAHVAELREAMDKTSGVTPIAAGAIKGRIGRLTSAAALRVTMQALLAKTEKKRTTYGGAIARMCELSLAWLDCAGLFKTAPEERRIELHWPSPIPENDAEKLQEAEAKSRLGVPREILLRELGY